MRIPRAILNLIEAFERLPGIGPKTASRLTFYLLHVPQSELDKFAQAVEKLKKETKTCSRCFNIDETDPCFICQDPGRDESTICVVEDALDLIAIEKTGKYKGVYHVLGGVIDPLNNIGPEEIRISELIQRVTPLRQGFAGQARETGVKGGIGVKEIILALNQTMEGEATCMYITKELRAPAFVLQCRTTAGKQSLKLKVTRIARGLPTGSDIEYADEVTLQRALEGRREY